MPISVMESSSEGSEGLELNYVATMIHDEAGNDGLREDPPEESFRGEEMTEEEGEPEISRQSLNLELTDELVDEVRREDVGYVPAMEESEVTLAGEGETEVVEYEDRDDRSEGAAAASASSGTEEAPNGHPEEETTQVHEESSDDEEEENTLGEMSFGSNDVALVKLKNGDDDASVTLSNLKLSTAVALRKIEMAQDRYETANGDAVAALPKKKKGFRVKNMTRMCDAAFRSDWDAVIDATLLSPTEAKIWVVGLDDSGESGEDKTWRFLPLHVACARQAPQWVVSSLVRTYSGALSTRDTLGMYPLHHACKSRSSGDVIRVLVGNYPKAAGLLDNSKRLPIHYLVKVGPSDPALVDLLLLHYGQISHAIDKDGKTPFALALDSDYLEKQEVLKSLLPFAEKKKYAPETAKRDSSLWSPYASTSTSKIMPLPAIAGLTLESTTTQRRTHRTGITTSSSPLPTTTRTNVPVTSTDSVTTTNTTTTSVSAMMQDPSVLETRNPDDVDERRYDQLERERHYYY